MAVGVLPHAQRAVRGGCATMQYLKVGNKGDKDLEAEAEDLGDIGDHVLQQGDAEVVPDGTDELGVGAE